MHHLQYKCEVNRLQHTIYDALIQVSARASIQVSARLDISLTFEGRPLPFTLLQQ